MSETRDSTLADPEHLIADLRRQLAECRAERDEALQRESATAEVLQVINSSPGDLASVFDAMLDRAMRLCGADYGGLGTWRGGRFVWDNTRGLPPALAEYLTANDVSVGSPSGFLRVARGAGYIHTIDLTASQHYLRGHPFTRAIADLGGARTTLTIPFCNDDTVLGVLGFFRREVNPFSDRQIALLQRFAAQAVIAVENARFLSETREALAQQTATSEILRVINSSPGNLDPVFLAILQKAHTLCEASFGALMTYDGELFRPVAHQGTPAAFREFLAPGIRPRLGDPFGRMVEGATLSHIHDLADVAAMYPAEALPRAAVDLGGIRTLLVVPLRKDNALLGVITAYRREVRPFTDKQIALLQSFAAQAVIAMENARLLEELRRRTADLQEALDHQTAIGNVLRVISGSVFDLDTVLDAVVSTAMQLCRADKAVIYRNFDDEYCWAAGKSLSSEYELIERQARIRPGIGTLVGRTALGAEPVHILDAWTDPLYEAKNDAQTGGVRTMLGVPLLRDGVAIGVIALGRQRIQAYSEKETELVRTFADQAVIAIENARLLTETREALERQTATAEVLQVINSSPGDLQPVFDAMLEKATSLCDAAFGVLWIVEGSQIRAVASHAVPAAYRKFLINTSSSPGSKSGVAQTVHDKSVLHFNDAASGEAYRSGDLFAVAAVELGGVRTLLNAPLIKDGNVLGILAIYRKEVRAFSDKQITLLENFAAQAVIAMENARLIDEIRQRQAELRVTFDNMGDGVAMFDAELKLAAWNTNFQKMLDLPDAVLAARPSLGEYFDYLAAHGEYPRELEAELRSQIGNPQPEMRFERTRPDGRVIEVRRNAVPGGGAVLIYSDITARKHAEEELRAARDAAVKALGDLQAAQASLSHAQKMASLGQLTAGIAHEIKNPLNFVNNFAGLSVELLDELKENAAPALSALDDEKRAEIDETINMLSGNLDKIAEHGRRADNIVTSMLEHSRGSSGERRSVDLNALVEEALNLAYHGGRAQDQSFNITLERDYADALAPIELVPQDIARICLNLFANGFYAATKRQKGGSDTNFKPALKVSTRDLGDTVEIRVRDNGCGIPPEIKGKLFQPFFTTKPTGEGTGLGLSISYDIVTQQHGGTIAVESEEGGFTEFIVRLPRHH